MADVHTQEIRSYPDSYREAAKGKNTKPEMLVRKFLHGNGYRYKRHDKGRLRQTWYLTGFAQIQ